MLKVAWSEIYAHPLPEGHRFPMEKYTLLPLQLLYEGTITEKNLFVPDIVDEQIILDTHKKEYWHRLKSLNLTRSEIRKTGFPLSEQLVLREQIITQGTVQAAYYALEYGIAMNIAGGTHHAFTDKGEGFCLLNDIAVAANHLLKAKVAQHILIVDLDVHQGNGTAEIFKDNTQVFTFSMHGKHNYPYKKEHSDLDVELDNGTDDKHYLGILENTLEKITTNFKPDFIFFQSGVDVLQTDKLGKLGLTLYGCKMRDQKVFEFAKQLNVPIVVSMGGGYSVRIADIIEAHANTYRLAQDLFF